MDPLIKEFGEVMGLTDMEIIDSDRSLKERIRSIDTPIDLSLNQLPGISRNN